MTEQELSFVSLSGSPAHDARATSKIVRSHVMRRYKSQKRAEARRGASANAIPSCFGKNGVSGKASSPESSTTGSATPDQDFALLAPSPQDPNESSSVFSQWPIHHTSGLDTLAALSGHSRWVYHPEPADLRTCLDGRLDPFSSLPISSTLAFAHATAVK